MVSITVNIFYSCFFTFVKNIVILLTLWLHYDANSNFYEVLPILPCNSRVPLVTKYLQYTFFEIMKAAFGMAHLVSLVLNFPTCLAQWTQYLNYQDFIEAGKLEFKESSF